MTCTRCGDTLKSTFKPLSFKATLHQPPISDFRLSSPTYGIKCTELPLNTVVAGLIKRMFPPKLTNGNLDMSRTNSTSDQDSHEDDNKQNSEIETEMNDEGKEESVYPTRHRTSSDGKTLLFVHQSECMSKASFTKIWRRTLVRRYI